MITHSTPRDRLPGWFVPLVAILALVVATAALTVALVGPSLGGFAGVGPGMMGGAGAFGRGGMIGRGGMMGGSRAVYPQNGPGPGDAGFVAGTTAAPRTIRVYAGPGFAFTPSAIRVARGETVTFTVTTMGPLIHEFMVGAADAVAADREGTPEISDIGMMQTKSLTFTFDGPGPYAFACHVDGHYEAGMRGTIDVVG
jgi:uncharacterized cupredoxin-like copper-binding protein